jgi:general secretion pathway protein M
MAGPILQMNARERKLVQLLGSIGAVVLVLAVPFGLEAWIHSARSDNEDLRQALADVQDARARVREQQAKKDAIGARYGRKAPPLAGYLEQTARQEKLEVTESTPLPDVPHGKRYIEHGSNVRLKKTGMLALAKFLEDIEKSGFPLSVSRLNVRKRSGEPDSYDVEAAVASYDRNEVAAPPAPAPAGSVKP